MFRPVICGNKTVQLKYGAKALITIEKLAGQKIGEAGIKIINSNAGTKLSIKDKIPLDLVLNFIDSDIELLLWLWGLGLDWKDSGAKPGDVMELYDAFMESTETLDTGERLREFKLAMVEAVGMARGIDAKKLMEKAKDEQEQAKINEMKRIYKAKILAEEEIKAEKEKNETEEDGTGTEPTESA